MPLLRSTMPLRPWLLVSHLRSDVGAFRTGRRVHSDPETTIYPQAFARGGLKGLTGITVGVGVHVPATKAPVGTTSRRGARWCRTTGSQHRCSIARGRITRIVSASTMRLNSGEREMPRNRWTMGIATTLVLTCASCSQTTADPDPSPPSTSSSTPTVSPTPTPTLPAYLAKYTPEERKAYAEAIANYSRFLRRNSEFLAAGATTKQANKFYRRYSIDWVVSWANLAQLANNNVKVHGTARELWVRPAEIELKPSGRAVVSLRRCLDEHEIVVRQNGKRLPQPQLKVPHVYRVALEKRVGETWWRSGVAEQGSPC